VRGACHMSASPDTVLTEQDIMASPAAAPSPELERMVGEGKSHKGESGMSKYV